MLFHDINPLEYGQQRLHKIISALNNNDLYNYDIKFESAYDHTDDIYRIVAQYKNKKLFDVVFEESLGYSLWEFSDEKHQDAPDTVKMYPGINTIPSDDAEPYLENECFIIFHNENQDIQISYSFIYQGKEYENAMLTDKDITDLIFNMRRFGEEIVELPQVQELVQYCPQGYTVEFHYNPNNTNCIPVSFMNPKYVSSSMAPLAWVNRNGREKDFGTYQYVKSSDSGFLINGILEIGYSCLVPNPDDFQDFMIEENGGKGEVHQVSISLESTDDAEKVIENSVSTTERIV